MLSFAIALILGVNSASPADSASMDPAAVYGRWMTPDHASVIEIYDCGDQTPCGRVTWLKDDPDGAEKDTKNRNKQHRDRSILGMVLLEGFSSCSEGWNSGSIYNPENGKTYRGRLKRQADGQLQVKGCVGPICKAMVWPAAPDDTGSADLRVVAAEGPSTRTARSMGTAGE